MNKVIDLDFIIEEMHKKFPEDSLSEIEKARYLYIELGKLLRYDINYESNYSFIREEALYKKMDANNITDNEYTCFQISDMYAELLRRAGINAESVYEKNRFGADIQHKFVEIKFKDGRKIATDLTYDLAYIQKGMRTSDFGTATGENSEYDKISIEELEKIDEKIKYTIGVKKDNSMYLETAIEMMKDDLNNEENLREYIRSTYSEEESKNYKPEYLIKYKLDLICRFFNLKDMGFREADTFLKYMYDNFFTHEEKKNVKKYFLSSENKSSYEIGKLEDLRCYVYKNPKGEKEFYLYEVGKNLMCLSKSQLEERLSQKNYGEVVEEIFEK